MTRRDEAESKLKLKLESKSKPKKALTGLKASNGTAVDIIIQITLPPRIPRKAAEGK
jgi:hypothetical protein